ncbi:heterokaryon incompatibility protein-domain-containing protein [Schizothecium vesticola]|uniref:Heterokaryon incompatibility protein-domain-containing protein n=1 Tax=Schizothecium vesticola TaxID=314040 RepID=A0AA40KAW6_9PEZI|nr:heterokaryon incompatibility protein-domain-containing protein [Schizothecium vesticola]
MMVYAWLTATFISRTNFGTMKFQDSLLGWVSKGSSAAHYVKTRPPNRQPWSLESIRWMKRCLRDCYKHHATCAKLRQLLPVHQPPKYLIDLESAGDGRICIVDTKGVQEDNLHFSILSYSWGSGQTSKTTPGNLKQRLIGFPFTDLPLTIQDAMTVTQALGLRYLWVDAICIQQDSDRQLFQQQLDAVLGLYAQATVVISAACADHSDAGFLKPRNQHYHQYDLGLTILDNGQRLDSRITLLERGFKKQREPVDTRIWTLQERNNAFCSFRFESEQVLWQCQETTCADGEVDMLPPYPDAYNAPTFDGSIFPSMLSTISARYYEGNLRKYLEHVSDFSKRQYTYFDNRLDAFALSASSMAKNMG